MVDARVQTMYRDTEAQTFPWSPPFVQASKELPEVLLLNNLKWGHGLPAGQYEVDEITRSRKKRAWEIYLASVQKTADIKFKKKIISQIESDDWEFIAQDLEKINEERMGLAKQVLNEQKVGFNTKLTKKIDILNRNIIERYEENVKKIQFERDKEIRRINNITKRQFEDRHEKKTIIDTFSDRMSDMYAFKVRLGYHRKNTSVVLCEDAFNKVKDTKVKQRKFSPPNRSGKMKKHNCLREQFIDTEDNEFDEYFRKLDFGFGFENQLNRKSKDSEITQEEEVFRSKSILSDERSLECEKDEESIENELNKEDSVEIEEKRQLFLQSFKQKCLEKQENESLKMHVSDVESALLAKLLDLTSKEQQRLEEEKKILTIALIAQAERWKREAREDGIRQKQKMREAIRVQLLDEAFERIDHDLEEEFQDILKESIMDTAIIETEEDMRTKIYNIDRDKIPKQDYGCKQEKMVAQLKDLICSKITIPIDERPKSLSDLGEINEVVHEMFQDVMSMAMDLDNLITKLAESEDKGTNINLVKVKLQELFNKKSKQPALELIKEHVEQIHYEYKLHQEINDDIKKMDKLCDTVMEVANNLYETVLGETSLQEIGELDNYIDSMVNEELLKYLDKSSTLYIFKLMKMSHILGQQDNKQLVDNSYQIMTKAKRFCTNVTKIAVKINCYLFENEYDETSEDELPADTELISEGTSKQDHLKMIRMERLCEKLMKKLTSKEIEDKEKLSNIKTKKESKIDLCQIKKEAGEIVESIVEVWIQISSLIDDLQSKEIAPESKEKIMSKLKCIIAKLEERFGNINEFLGIRELQCLLEPSNCDEATEEMLRYLRRTAGTELEKIIDIIAATAVRLNEKKQKGLLDLLKEITFIEEPLRTDITSMIKETSLFVAIPKLLI